MLWLPDGNGRPKGAVTARAKSITEKFAIRRMTNFLENPRRVEAFLRPPRMGKKPIEFVADRFVRFATSLLQLRPVRHGHLSALKLDNPLSLKSAGCLRGAFVPDLQ